MEKDKKPFYTNEELEAMAVIARKPKDDAQIMLRVIIVAMGVLKDIDETSGPIELTKCRAYQDPPSRIPCGRGRARELIEHIGVKVGRCKNGPLMAESGRSSLSRLC